MTSIPPELPASWASIGDGLVLRIDAVDLGEQLSPRRLLAWGGLLAIALLPALLIGISGGEWHAALGIGLFLAASAGAVVYLATLRARCRTLELRFEPGVLHVADGAQREVLVPYSELRRLLIAHDGAPTRIRITTDRGTRRWTIGQLYRHNRVEPFIDALPHALEARLRAEGLNGGTRTVRRVRISEWRRS